MSAGTDFGSFSVIARSLSPAVVIAWVALSAVVLLLPSKTTESASALCSRRVFGPSSLAMTLIMGTAVWHQVTGDYIPFARAWPSAVAMGFAMSLLLVVMMNLQERPPFAMSLLVLVVGSIPGSVGFAGVFFLLPVPVRWELELFGLL
ncbi:MAG TPA: hypothetical protein VI168_09395 [Croceibacterium sp.]